MFWFVLYKSRSQKGQLVEKLQQAGITYFQPIHTTEILVGDKMVVQQKEVFKNLIFLKTDQDIHQLVRDIEGLRGVYMDAATGRPAVICDAEMERFKRVLQMQAYNIEFMNHPIQFFHKYDKVRVRAGEFAGMEGWVVRVRGDRKLVINIDSLAIAVSGIHHSLLEKI